MSGRQEHFNNLFYEIVTGRFSNKPPFQRPCRIDIIIPIFNAMELTAACLETVLDNSDNCRLILVNDASTDPRVADYLDSVRSIPDKMLEVVVLHNEVNQGFIKTVNDAYMHTQGHFVILNSDTEVPPSWLDRLFAPIFASPSSIASVTPFSNSSMGWLGCNFPDPEQDGEIFKGMEVALLDSFFSRYSINTPIEIFSGCGFCMAFNRAVVERIGLFDYKTFGKGYGEEVDWSLRAVNAGYKNTLVPDLFVYHMQSASFDQNEKRLLVESNVRKLSTKYPIQMEQISFASAKNSVRSIRDTVAIISDAHTRKDKEVWVAILGCDYSSFDIIRQRFESYLSNAVGYIFITYEKNRIILHVVSQYQDRIIYLQCAICDNITDILNTLNINVVIISKQAVWPFVIDFSELINDGTRKVEIYDNVVAN